MQAGDRVNKIIPRVTPVCFGNNRAIIGVDSDARPKAHGSNNKSVIFIASLALCLAWL